MGRPGCNGHAVSGLGTGHLGGRCDQRGRNQGGGGGGGGLEGGGRGGEGTLQRAGEGEAREPGVERLQAPPVVLARHGARRQERLGGAHDEPQREQALPLGSPDGVRDQPDQARLRGSGRAGHATRRSTAAATSSGVMSARQRWWPSGQAAVPVAEQGRQSSARSRTAARARYGKKPNCPTVGPNSATTGVPTPVAMCMTPVSPDTTTRARASSAPVSWSENSPAALATAPPPSATSCCASPRSSGPPTMTGRYPAAPSRSARALQCATGQRLVAWAAPGASAASRAPPSPRSASHCAARSVAPGPRQNSGGPPSGRVSRRRAASK